MEKMKPYFILFFSLLLGNQLACTSAPNYPDALTPEEALDSFELHGAFQIEVFAAEPLVQDPVSMVFDERGRAFAVEMPDYPNKPAPGQGKSRILLLQDSDKDGRIDQHTVFVDSLSEATSALPWKGGLIVTAAPDILYLKDTDDDGEADMREVLFTGFFENNSEAQITNLRLSVDNWIYASNFGQAGMITSTRNPALPPLDVTGGDFRFRLDTNEFEVAAGPTQFGQGIDDWGNRFVTHNTTHISHLVIPWRYLHRHPYLPDPSTITNISDHDLRMYQRTPAPYWRAERTRRRQQQYDEAGSGRIEYAADHFTGSSGGTVYDGSLFPETFYGNIFTGDVAGNLIHRDLIVHKPGSPTFIAQRAPDERNREFLASVDSWFRPASFTVGPDGALYVVDMYRQHIETPLSIPEDLKADMDFYNGSDKGRIYRITPASDATPYTTLLELADPVELLSHRAGWWRRTGQRLLLERQDKSTIPLLRSLFQQSDAPQARLYALYGLEGLNVLTSDDVGRALDDVVPEIRVHAIRLAERFPAFFDKTAVLTTDASSYVALQAALSVGSMEHVRQVPVLVEFTLKHLDDPWMRLAVLSSETGSSIAFLEALLNHPNFTTTAGEGQTAFVKTFTDIVSTRNTPGEVDRLKVMLPDLLEEGPTTNNTP